MPLIKDDVLSDHLAKFPAERELLVPFLNNFDITWGKRRRAYNTELSIYFLQPQPIIRDQFGIETEILLAISGFDQVQARAMQAIDQILSDDPARGRVDQMAFFLVSRDNNARDWVSNYCAINPQARLPVVFAFQELSEHKADAWYIRTAMINQLYARDLFKQQLPVINDLFFFGRDRIVADFVSAVRQSENRGLFGLRKTGKTSLLYKVKRVAEQSGVAVLYYDCKSPSIRNLDWTKFFAQIIDDIYSAIGLTRKRDKNEHHITIQFSDAVAAATKAGKRLAIIFDEIEWISHIATLDAHWKKEFVPFWQTMWTTQSQFRNLALIIAGVNPAIVETDTVEGVQNPVFGIVTPIYLTGFEEKELRSMLHFLGKRVGLRFDHGALNYLHNRYGGHPLLTRLACSYINAFLIGEKTKRPIDIGTEILEERADDIERELTFYCRHIVSELRSFYPDEYYMLETLAAGNAADFIDLARDGENIMRPVRGSAAGRVGRVSGRRAWH